MQFVSLRFFAFLPICFLLYFVTKKEYRYLVLLVANFVFYGWDNLNAIPVLAAAIVLTWVGGLVLHKYKIRWVYALFFSATLLILVFYKYTGFMVENINLLAKRELFTAPSLLAPIGLSFFIFQSSSYLNDVSRKNMSPEKNLLRYAAFVSFFPTVMSGPIQRSRDILPQLKNPSEFSFERAKTGVLLLVWGFFQKIVVSGSLAAISDQIYNDYQSYDNVYFLLAAVCYSLYIYCDFSCYSDMACGVAQILGFDIRPNFRNPYLAENLADFWNRWHMSLNTWFVENIYIPLGGNRKGTVRKYLNILAVFFFSGIWHGASWNFIIWGLLNGVLRVLGEITAPLRKRIYAGLKIDETAGSIRIFKKLIVFSLITITWVFFRMPTLESAMYVINNMLFFQPISLANSELITLLGTSTDLLKFVLFLSVFLYVQYLRKEDGMFIRVWNCQPELVQHLLIAVAILVCIFAACSGTATFDTQFVYFQF